MWGGFQRGTPEYLRKHLSPENKVRWNWQRVTGQVNGTQPRLYQHVLCLRSRLYPMGATQALIWLHWLLKLICQSRGQKVETVSSHLVQKGNMEDGINQIINDTMEQIAFKKRSSEQKKKERRWHCQNCWDLYDQSETWSLTLID